MGLLPRLIVLVAALLAVSAAPARGQEEEGPVTLTVLPRDGSLRLRLGSLLEEGSLRDALESGLPLRILVQAQLWKDRFFDSHEGLAEWRATVIFEPLDRSYRVRTSGSPPDPPVEGTVESLDEARAMLQRSFHPNLEPGEEGRFYYLVRVEVETLSLSDLEELQRWLRGDLGPAVSGEAEAEGAVARGFRRLFVRVLGLPTRRLELRTPTFRFDPDRGVVPGG